MDVPAPINESLSNSLKLQIKRFETISGGCINHGGRLITEGGTFFLKWNDAAKFPGMFETEAKGLQLLNDGNSIRIPNVIENGVATNCQYIVMEFINAKSRNKKFWELLGERLAALHRNAADQYGLDHDNYIGSLRQPNDKEKNWTEFLINQRLLVQLNLASQNGFADKTLLRSFENLFKKLDTLLPVESPSLLHGDLWSGNLIVDELGEPCLIDPAVYYGNREIEIAFTRLFGGFERKFYKAYDDAFPLQSGFKERADIYNLYPLLVHLNLFGRAYLSDINRILKRYN